MLKTLWEKTFFNPPQPYSHAELRFDPKQFWIGVRIERRVRIGYEMRPGQKVHTSRTGNHWQNESITVIICLIPCLSIRFYRSWP